MKDIHFVTIKLLVILITLVFMQNTTWAFSSGCQSGKKSIIYIYPPHSTAASYRWDINNPIDDYDTEIMDNIYEVIDNELNDTFVIGSTAKWHYSLNSSLAENVENLKTHLVVLNNSDDACDNYYAIGHGIGGLIIEQLMIANNGTIKRGIAIGSPSYGSSSVHYYCTEYSYPSMDKSSCSCSKLMKDLDPSKSHFNQSNAPNGLLKIYSPVDEVVPSDIVIGYKPLNSSKIALACPSQYGGNYNFGLTKSYFVRDMTKEYIQYGYIKTNELIINRDNFENTCGNSDVDNIRL